MRPFENEVSDDDEARPAGPPPPRLATMPTEYTPAFLVRAYDEFMRYITTYLGEHIYNVFQEMRTDAEQFAKQQSSAKHKVSPKEILKQLLGEVQDWRHLPVSKGDSATVLDQEVDAVRQAVPDLMFAVEDAMRTGHMVLSGARGTSAEAITVKVPSMRNFVDDVFVRTAKQYSGRNGTTRLARHLTINKDKLLGAVQHASSAALFPRESLWGAPEDKGHAITVPPTEPPKERNSMIVPLAGGQEASGSQPQPQPQSPNQDSAPAQDKPEGFKDAEIEDGGSESASGSEDGF